MTKKHILPAVAFLVFQTSMSVNLLPAFAADDASNVALVDMIRHASIVNPGYKLTAAVTGGEALVTTQSKPKATEADQKIEAVLIAKTAFESLSDSVQRVRLLLLDYEANNCSSIIVKRAEVKLFGSGGLSQKELLDSLEISQSSNSVPSTDSSVVEGPEQLTRMLTFGRIEKLKSQGANVSGYVSFFKQIEDAAKAGDAEAVKTKCAYLGEKLSDQEGSIKQIRTRTVTPVAKAAPTTLSAASVTAASASTLARPTVAAVKGALGKTLSDSQLASINPYTIGLGYRNNRMSEKLQALQSRGVDTSYALTMSVQVQSLLWNGQLSQADSILAQLEYKYGR